VDGFVRALWAASVLALASMGCEVDETSSTADPSGPCQEVAGVGVPEAVVCDADVCTAGVSCDAVLTVAEPGALAGAIAQAKAGDCIALAPGTYGAAKLPAGVSLLGKGAGFVTVAGALLGGKGAVVRGVRVEGALEVAAAAEEARIEAVCVTAASSPTAIGLAVGAGASALIAGSEVTGAPLYGVRAFDVASLSLDRVRIVGTEGPGLWAQCTGGCDCASKPKVSLGRVRIEKSELVGAALHGVSATASELVVVDTVSATSGLQGGGGLSLSHCTDFDVARLQIDRTDSFGLLVSSATGSLGSPGEEKGIIITGGRPGAWIDAVAASGGVTLRGFEILASGGVGVGVGGGSKGIIITGGKISGTTKLTAPVEGGGAVTLGHGVQWGGVSQAELIDLSVSASALRGVLIDGPVADGSRIVDLVLAGGDEADGVLQQNVVEGAAAPVVESDGTVLAAPKTTTAAAYDTADAPKVPAAL
jgi:hypothetical protein